MHPCQPLPTGGRILFPTGRCTELRLRDLPDDRMSLVREEGFDEPVMEVHVDRQGDTPWAFLLRTEIDGAGEAGDVVHVRFWARNVESMTGASRIAVTVEDSSGTQSGKIVDLPVTVGSEWECVDVPMTLTRSHEPLKWIFTIRLGYAPQRLRIARVEILNFRTSVAASGLPRVRTGYEGRELDAAWRAEALARIDRLRRRDVTLRLSDARGAPLRGTKVRATLKRHAFAFGTAVSTRYLQDDEETARYREAIETCFSSTVIENALKWPAVMESGYGPGDELVRRLRTRGLPVRGHCLVWPSKRFLPAHVVAAADDPSRFAKLIADRVRDAVTRYRGQLIDWDVINEPYAHHFAMDVLGRHAMVEWFQIAHEADPKARLYINDYEILESGDRTDTAHQESYFRTIEFLLQHGARLHGVGIQGHFGCNITSPVKMLKILDRFAALGVRIQVTELDVQLGDESLRADYFRDALITLMSHPAVDGITQWGFWEGCHWIPPSALFNRDWTIRPHGRVFLDLVHGQWKTDVTLTADDAGVARFRGFAGDYQFTLDAGADTQKWTGRVDAPQQELQLRAGADAHG